MVADEDRQDNKDEVPSGTDEGIRRHDVDASSVPQQQLLPRLLPPLMVLLCDEDEVAASPFLGARTDSYKHGVEGDSRGIQLVAGSSKALALLQVPKSVLSFSFL